MHNILSDCSLCPRNCHINRFIKTGFCNSNFEIVLSKAYLHMWEEPCISGSNGSGCLFFSNCNLSCVFCQNHEISQSTKGKIVSIDQLSDIMLKMQYKGAHNINLVTPTHYAPLICEAISIAKKSGLTIPIIYNTNSYESVDTINLVAPFIDIFLADFKYFDDDLAIKYSNAPNYLSVAQKSIKAMFDAAPHLIFEDKTNLMKKGIIIRHLMLPGHSLDTKNIINYLFKTHGQNFYLSLMNQYTPSYRAFEYENLSRTLSQKRYHKMIDYCVSIGIENLFIQDKGSASKDYIPDFNILDF